MRYDILTEEELAQHNIRYEVQQHIDRHLKNSGGSINSGNINILDWGCGRGESVLNLLDRGYNAYGVEIDAEVIQKGFSLFQKRGRKPEEIVMHLDDIRRFSAGFFHVIFSEEVMEHVELIDEVTHELSRLTRHGGTGIHLFPGSRKVIEPHLFMPFIHWLPKHPGRQIALAFFLLLGIGPKWPHLRDSGIWKEAEAYRSYLDRHVYYRDLKSILGSFRAAGFETEYWSYGSRINKWMPHFLRRNGFPGGGIALTTFKQ